MVVSTLFKEAVAQNNVLRVRIMLKDSLLVDPSFRLFDEMANYASQYLSDLWVEDSKDTEILFDSQQELDAMLVGLVYTFSNKRVEHLKQMIREMTPSLPSTIKQSEQEDVYWVINPSKSLSKKLQRIYQSVGELNSICWKIQHHQHIHTGDVENIHKNAQVLIRACAEISELRGK